MSRRKELRKILVLAGGPGSERQVSLVSGKAILNGLLEKGYDARMADVTPNDLSALDSPDFDLAFPIIHGTFGEDGQLQAILEERSIAYIGSGPAASRIAMDKHETRKVFQACGVPVAPGILIKQNTTSKQIENQVGNFIRSIGLPVVVKPNCEGSSVGVTIVKEAGQAIADAIGVVEKFGDCLIEQFVEGRELTAGILIDKALPLIEICAASGFYDYQAKYIKNDTSYRVNPDVKPQVTRAIQAGALKVFQTMGCLDLGRIDFILKPDDTFIALEVNTLPGFTDHSLVPKAAAYLGLSMAQICDKIVQNAWNRSIK